MNKRIILLITGLALLQACGDEQEFFPQLKMADASLAKVKFIHAASDTVGVNLYSGDIKVTGNASTKITTADSPNLGQINIGTVAYQSSFPITDYAYIPSGSSDLKIEFPITYTNTETKPSKLMATKNESLAASTYYTVAFVGVSPDYEAITFQDDLASTPIDGKAYLRFANLIHNSTDNLTIKATPPVTTEDPAPSEITLFTNVSYKSMSNFIALPRTGTYTNVRIYNAVTNALIATLTASQGTFVNNKVYTLIARGQIGGTSTKAPGVSRFINR